MITVTECKQQCSIEADIVEFDPWFRRTIPAAVAAVKQSIGRPLYETQQALDDAKSSLEVGDSSLDFAIVVTEDLRHAMLMLIGHWFENRESTSTLNVSETPMGFDFLVNPYRCLYI